MNKSHFARMGMVAAAVLLAACASTPGGEEAAGAADPNAITVQVTNATVPPTSITIWVQPETGSRRRLGTISPSGQGTFTYVPGVRGMEHRLVAEHVGGGQSSSNPFLLTGVSRVTWQTSSPAVQTSN